MDILIIGQSGQLATELLRRQWPRGVQVIGLGREQLDVTDPVAVDEAVAAIAPDIIINAAAYTAVDRAESERAQAFAVNHLGPQHLARAAASRHIPLIHVSTDYVFDGEGSRAWKETDPTAPLSVYGQSKLAGEQAIAANLQEHVILRTSWLFAAHGQNFVRTMLRLGRERDRLSVVVDQIGCPTSAADLARVIAEITMNLMSGGKNFGIYHYAGRDAVTWHQFAQAIFALAGHLIPRPPLIAPISTKEFGAPAPRPGFSVLDCRKIETTFGIERAFWQSELERVLAEIRD